MGMRIVMLLLKKKIVIVCVVEEFVVQKFHSACTTLKRGIWPVISQVKNLFYFCDGCIEAHQTIDRKFDK